MAELYRDLLQKFRDDPRVASLYPRTEQANGIVQRYAHQWQDNIGIMKFQMMPTMSPFDRAWIFNLTARSDHKRRKNAKIPAMVVEVDSASGKLLIARTDLTVQCMMNIKNDPYGFVTHVHKHLNQGKETFDSLQEFAKSAVYVAAGQFAKKMRGSALPLNMHRVKANKLYELGRDIAQDYLADMVSAAISEITPMIDHDALNFTTRLLRDKTLSLKYVVDIYNHILDAPTKEARLSRMNALAFMARTGHLFLTNTHRMPYADLWDAIDTGASPIKTFAQWASVSPGTVRNILSMPDLPSLGMDLPPVALYLEKITPNRWPQNAQELAWFKVCKKAAEVYAKTFSGTGPDILRQWVKESGPKTSWKRIAFRRLKKQIGIILKEPRVTERVGYKPVGVKVKDFVPDLAFIRIIMDRPNLWKLSLELYETELKNIRDMKVDIAKRLTTAAAILELNKRGLDVFNVTVFNTLALAAEDVLWGRTPPSEQIEASSYWHSPRIRIGQRFNSLSQGDLEWHTMLPKPYTFSNGVTAYPLESSAALREEADAMQHCVWSYAHNCMKNGYHIFSLRNKDGKRLSTLSLVDEKNEDGHRLVRESQNRAWDNKPPVAEAAEAAKMLMKMINDKTIPMQWDKVDAARADYAARDINLSIGYDVHDPEIRQSVFDLYAPCLPRRIYRLSQGLFDHYAQALQLPALVDAVLSQKSDAFRPYTPAAPK